MPNVVRFALSTSRTLHVAGAGTFVSGVLDVPATNVSLVDRTRYLVQPYRAVELGTMDSATALPTLPASPPVVIPDPYPQYVTADELTTALAGVSGGSVPDASTTVKGKVELATTAETTTGTDTVRAVTPAGVKAATDALVAPTATTVSFTPAGRVAATTVQAAIAEVDAEKSLLIEAVNTVATSGAAQTLPDVTTATIHDITLTANCTFTFPTVAAGKSLTVRLTQDGTGSRTATWPATVKWPGGLAPTLSTAAGKQDVVSFVSIGGTNWSGFVSGLDIR